MNDQGYFRFSKIGVRIGIVAAYLSIIAVCLYTPIVYYLFSSNQRVLNIYTFTNNFKAELIQEFERFHNVRVNIRYFDSNEELLAKFKINGGDGYDIVTPSDYMVELLRDDGLLYKFDKAKLPIFAEIDPRLMRLYFDPNNDYSIPLMWFPYGIIYAKDIFDNSPDSVSYSLLFEDPKKQVNSVMRTYRTCMGDDYRESIVFASLYLYGEYDAARVDRLPAIKALLVQQKQWVESYANQDLCYYLSADTVKVAVAPAVFVRKLMEQSEKFEFKIPQEGGLLVVESMVIPRQARNIELAYAFINFILGKEQAFQNSDFYGFNPTNKEAYQFINKRFLENENFFPNDEQFKKLSILHNKIPVHEYEELWLAVKSD